MPDSHSLEVIQVPIWEDGPTQNCTTWSNSALLGHISSSVHEPWLWLGLQLCVLRTTSVREPHGLHVGAKPMHCGTCSLQVFCRLLPTEKLLEEQSAKALTLNNLFIHDERRTHGGMEETSLGAQGTSQ